MDKQKVIALIDCDSFFVSCEQRRNPELKGKPVCVLSNNDGCVISRSKEAKEIGIKMGEPYFIAKKEHPKAAYISADHEFYSIVSKEIMNILKNFSPYVEIYSIDEAFIDLTGLTKLYKNNYRNMAVKLRKEILDQTSIPVSIGVSSTKTLAKLASDKSKNTQDGVFIIGKRKINKVLQETNIEEILGIGKNLTKRLKTYGILTAYEFISKPDDWLNSKIGINGIEIRHELLGNMVSGVSNEKKLPKSIQNTKSFGIFTSDFNFIKNELNKHIHTSCKKLRLHNTKCYEIGVMLRTKDFKVFYTKKELLTPVNFELDISSIAIALLSEIYNQKILYRSTGIYLNKIIETSEEQLSLLPSNNKKTDKLAKCLDKLEEKFGKNIVQTGFTKN